MTEAEVLKTNLLEYCSLLTDDPQLPNGLSEEELVGHAECNWVQRLAQIITNLQNPKRTSHVNDRLTFLLGQFNAKHDSKVSDHFK